MQKKGCVLGREHEASWLNKDRLFYGSWTVLRTSQIQRIKKGGF
jgi:hypothetical protein